MSNNLLESYLSAPDGFDEMLDAARVPRAHWRAMLDSLEHEPPDMMRQRHEMVQRQVRENGVTYNVRADADGLQRPWDLNVLPLILPYEEWSGIEAAVIQRARLLNKILGDVYGPQDMLREGLLPPALVHGHAGFLRPCHGMSHHDDIALHFYAVDLARAPDGRWWVLADRTQAPSGAGYALENRAIISPTFPDLLRELKVQPLSGFFRTMRDSLVHWGRLCAANGDSPAPLREGEMPLIVLLTPGPRTESYYEQAYLARHLGLPLVEGSDLTVRDGVVYLKTLAGLHRVHVIIRRVDDESCDPLELRSSMLGVAGLTQAARRGNVLVSNSLGSSLLESGALLGFLPALSRRLLGEPLKMPSVATWWCGEPAALEAVIAKLDRLVIKPSFSQLPPVTVFGQDLAGDAREALIAKLRANPNNYIAQEVVQLSRAPVWKPGAASGLQPRAIGLRVFACATPNGYVVMPGGLTRVATGPDARVLTMKMGGASKDTWVQARARVSVPRLQQRSITGKDLVREDSNLSSRVAENLLWFGRYAERCDNIARLLRVALNFLFNVRFDQRGAEWPTVEALCIYFQLIDGERRPVAGQAAQMQSQTSGQGGQSQSQSQAVAIFTDAELESALLLAVVSPNVPGLARQQQQLVRLAGQLHERFSVDNWRALNRMAQPAARPGERPSQSEAMTILDDAASSLMTLAGFALDGMTRDLGWRFMSIGRRLERLQFQSVVLQRALAMDENGNLEWLLELSDSIITYRARYRAQPEWLPVLDLLLRDGTNPRSILFQMDGILGALRKIALTHGDCGVELLAPLREEVLALEPDADLNYANAHLSDLLNRIQVASAALSEKISVQFFSYTDGQQRSRRS
ncbi:circularly permuted type 2 ATP-grasp protein [Pseudoduganella umbonata]|uniref:Molybdopterin oxidoreductase n=1 Tax=Pseudoduganella umbonata TaxID=864828 RepID=A0A4P8HW79_9BURK|nr:circularly permuted type 2 ATP-grasp protein [Pseudoduganella umbonata]MBB3223464.1 putative circularly permuted ATP-grasp superfamily protein/putative alpha-E superfamily protein [Pseudoduganella umbonata]QCP13646.1 molybdopterin oxidoreductase [Pseudoduganella umbonata]